MNESKKILIVDDEKHNRILLARILRKAGFNFAIVKSGEEALTLLARDRDYVAILLDRMMPGGMNGIEVLKEIKGDELLKEIPIIFQTAMAQPEEVAEGIAAGAFYYITKPYPPDVQLLAIVQAAIDEHEARKIISAEALKVSKGLRLIDKLSLSLRTLEDAQVAVLILSGVYSDPVKAVIGLQELLWNALEHGNAGIDYDEKTILNEIGNWQEEVERRLDLPENQGKMVHVSLVKQADVIQLIIKDDGLGFNYKKYLGLDPDRATDNHGRGIAMANMFSFDSLEYQGCGNEVVVTTNL